MQNLYQGGTKIEHYRIRTDKMLTLFNFFRNICTYSLLYTSLSVSYPRWRNLPINS